MSERATVGQHGGRQHEPLLEGANVGPPHSQRIGGLLTPRKRAKGCCARARGLLRLPGPSSTGCEQEGGDWRRKSERQIQRRFIKGPAQGAPGTPTRRSAKGGGTLQVRAVSPKARAPGATCTADGGVTATSSYRSRYGSKYGYRTEGRRRFPLSRGVMSQSNSFVPRTSSLAVSRRTRTCAGTRVPCTAQRRLVVESSFDVALPDDAQRQQHGIPDSARRRNPDGRQW